MVKNGSLIKLDYSAKIDGEAAEKATGLVVAVGKNHVLKGFDDALQATEVGVQSTVVVPPEKGYGQRNPDLVRLVPMEVFRRQGVDPVPGMVVELDDMPAKVQSVSGGRIRGDFNHELAGKTVTYDFKIVEELTTPLTQVSAIASQFFEKGASCTFDEATKIANVRVTSATCMSQGYLQAKARMLSMIIAFVDQVKKVDLTEEYEKLESSQKSEKK